MGSPYYPYGKKGELSYPVFKEIVKFANGAIEIFASVFDIEHLQWCENLGIKRYKIAARQYNNRTLAEAVRATGKPVIQSLDPYYIRRINRASSVLPLIDRPALPSFSAQTSYLYCCSKYPATIDELHLGGIDFHSEWDGLSDHTIGLGASLTALARGAKIIEKHFTLDKSATGFDHLWSMTPSELLQLTKYQKVLKEVYGDNRGWIITNGDEF